MAKYKELDIIRLKKDGRMGAIVGIWSPVMYSIDVGTGTDDDPFDNIDLHEDEIEPFDFLAPRHCPVYNEVISDAICMETEAALFRRVTVATVPEMSKIADLDVARKKCDKCLYHNY